MLKHKQFEYGSQLHRFINEQGIKREQIQAIVGSRWFVHLYWWED